MTRAELLDLRRRLRYVADLLIDIREGLPEDEQEMTALAIRGVERDLVTIAGAVEVPER